MFWKYRAIHTDISQVFTEPLRTAATEKRSGSIGGWPVALPGQPVSGRRPGAATARHSLTQQKWVRRRR